MRNFFFNHILFLSFIFCSVSYPDQEPVLFSAKEHSTLQLVKFPIFKLYDDSPITFQNRKAYQCMIDRWQLKLHKGAEKLFDRLYEELNVTAEEIYEQFNNPSLITRYHILQKADDDTSQTFIHEEDADVEVISFIRNVLQRYTTKKNIKIILTDSISTNTATYGSDFNEHYLFCNAQMYTKENIRKFYASLHSDNKSFYMEGLPNHAVRWITISNLLMIGLIEACSHIQHQTHLLTFLIAHCNCNGKRSSRPTIQLCIKLHKFLSLLEAVFQSVNPLEAAIFLMHSPHRTDVDKKIWRNIVKDIALSYSPNSLDKFKAYADQIKQQTR